MAAPINSAKSNSLQGKISLITGASSGIGKATAENFATLGSHLVLTGRNEEALQETVDRCTKLGVQVLSVIADLTIEADVERVMEQTISKFSKLDILVNNAGIVEKGTIEDTSLKQYDDVMNTNVRSIYHLTMLAVPHLIASQGAIVNVSSINGIRSFPGVLAYCVSKSAVDQFTRCIALELAAKNVRVNSVNPGVIVTNIHTRGGMNEEQYEAFLERSKTTHAMGRVGQPEEVAKAIAFLASEDSSFTTGAQLPVDGGRGCMCPR